MNPLEHANRPQGVGAPLKRKEDDRFMRGRGEYVGNIRMVGMLDVAFVRSPIAHGHIVGIEKPAGLEHAVYTMADLPGVLPIVANSSLPGFKSSEQPVLASGKVRQVGETIAMCVAETRAAAEDIAAQVFVDFEELPAVTDMLAARLPESALVHEHWGDNVFLETRINTEPNAAFDAAFDSIRSSAAIKVQRKLRTARQSMAPMEGRGVVAHWDKRLSQLIVHTSAQMVHVTRTGLAQCLGLDEGQVRVISPDVGGGFGYKGILLPEEVCLGWLAMRLGRPVRWVEDGLAAHGRDADAVSVVPDPADRAVEREILVAEAKPVEQRDRPGPHGDDVPEDPPAAGGRPRERLGGGLARGRMGGRGWRDRGASRLTSLPSACYG